MSRAAARSLTEARGSGALPIMGAFVRAYPARCVSTLFGVFVAGLLDGLGLSMLLSMLSLAAGEPGAHPSKPERVALDVVAFLGLQPTTLTLLLLAIGMISLKAGITLLANRQVGYTVAHIATDLRLSVIRAVLGARWRHYQRQSLGRLSNAVAGEAARAGEIFQQGIEMSALALNSLIYLVIVLSISTQAGLAAIVAGSGMLVLTRRLIRTSRRAGQQQNMLLKSLMSTISSKLVAVKPLKAMAREDHVDALLSDETRRLRKVLRRQVIAKETLQAVQDPLLAVMVAVGFFLCLTVLRMPMASVLVMLFLLSRTVSYLSKAQRAYQQVVNREAAFWSIVQTIDAARAQSEPSGGERHVQLAREIRFENVSFAHEPANAILDHQSFVIPAGELTVIVGASGAGKTTILDLIVGLLQPDGGRVLVDGVPLEELQLRDWRRQIGYVPQESVLTSDSVLYNLALGEALPEEEIRDALRAADALDFVSAMPEGLQTPVGEGGSRLSGGQRQRLAIARALIHKPHLLILDEATSNLDALSQAAVIETIGHLKGRLTILAVAHQERLVAAADRVYRLSGGRLEAVPPNPARAAAMGS